MSTIPSTNSLLQNPRHCLRLRKNPRHYLTLRTNPRHYLTVRRCDLLHKSADVCEQRNPFSYKFMLSAINWCSSPQFHSMTNISLPYWYTPFWTAHPRSERKEEIGFGFRLSSLVDPVRFSPRRSEIFSSASLLPRFLIFFSGQALWRSVPVIYLELCHLLAGHLFEAFKIKCHFLLRIPVIDNDEMQLWLRTPDFVLQCSQRSNLHLICQYTFATSCDP